MTMLFVIDDPNEAEETYCALNANNVLSPISKESFDMLSEMGFQVAQGGPWNPVAVIGVCQYALGSGVIGFQQPGPVTPSP